MAIGTNAAVWFFGTEDTADDGATQTIADGAYSVDVATWTNDDDAPQAAFVLTFQYPSGTIDTGGIHLFARLLNTNSTTDEPVPSATWLGHYLGSFPTGTGMAATTNYAVETGPVDLPLMKTSQEYEFYIKNDCNVTISASWTLKVTPMTIGPHA
jgi:hypothetical protein